MKQRFFEYEKIEICRHCGGVGYLPAENASAILPVCPVCGGNGRVAKQTKGTVTIQPYSHDNSH